MRISKGFPVLLLICIFSVLVPRSQAGPVFPQGDVSFADLVVDYSPGIVASGPTVPYRVPENALGGPDSGQPGVRHVSLGVGGSIILKFVDNVLTGSGDNSHDLWVFEIGPDVEDIFVDISVNASDWISVGKVTGGTTGIDIDAFGYGIASQFAYVRLTDDPDEGNLTGDTVGADIDALGAISTIPTPTIPAPGAVFLAGVGASLVTWLGRRRAI